MSELVEDDTEVSAMSSYLRACTVLTCDQYVCLHVERMEIRIIDYPKCLRCGVALSLSSSALVAFTTQKASQVKLSTIPKLKLSTPDEEREPSRLTGNVS